ncbi:MAG: class I SAM-dependent methyltransferase [Leptospirales bacterium]
MILVIYTKKYRKGSYQFQLAAETLMQEKRVHFPEAEIVCCGIVTKKEFKNVFRKYKKISELHFFGHSGMYGPMFSTISFPEQMSRAEWRDLKIDFSPDARAYFLCCRSARWFAPFFAHHYRVTAFGVYWYTTVSSNKTRFKWAMGRRKNEKPLYIVGCPGKKSHGMIGSLLKYSGFAKAEKLKEFAARPAEEESYNKVAAVYNEVFSDINVRRDEMNWIHSVWPKGSNLSILDVGCGNGALLKELSGKIKQGIGVDNSSTMIKFAKLNNIHNKNINFEQITEPKLKFKDNSFDLVISLLSFRYLDWDPVIHEILRVLKEGGSIIIIDMVAKPVAFSEYAQFILSKTKTILYQMKNRRFSNALQKMVHSKEWRQMVQYNPIRDEHEILWYLTSRFPDVTIKKLNIGWNARTIGFSTGPLKKQKVINHIKVLPEMTQQSPE